MNTSTSVSPSSGEIPEKLAADPCAKMLIDGHWVSAKSGSVLRVFDPSMGRQIAEAPAGDVADVNEAVEAARRSFQSGTWAGLGPSQRANVLWRTADIIESRTDQLAYLETLDNGMPLSTATQLVGLGAQLFRYYAGWCTKIHGMTSEISAGSSQFHAYTLREPIGVVGLIIPWNAPFYFACNKLSVALAAGCSCVLKPAEDTPLTALKLGGILIDAGVPPGVVNIVTGFGETVGANLSAHPDIDKVAFTGSTEVGRHIVRAAAGNLKKVTLELGGKSPVIVFDDADIDKVVAGASMGVFMLSGQICQAGSRLYVQRKRFDEVVSGIVAQAKSIRVGSGFDPQVQMGPLISAVQLDRVTRLIASGVQQGAHIETGGSRLGEHGYFVEPTVMTNVPRTARVSKEEIFGPVITTFLFDDIEEVTALANDTGYGLAAAVWTRDIRKAHLMAKRVAAGSLWINCQMMSDVSMPYGGYKQSGWGRENGWEGLDAYLQTKSVFAQL
jgi:phenylacetaldehyde dehydrogenase